MSSHLQQQDQPIKKQSAEKKNRNQDMFIQSQIVINNNSNQSNPPYKIKKVSREPSYDFNQQQYHIKQRTIQFGGSNCIIEPNIALLLILYDMSSFRKYLCLTPAWHHLVLSAMDEHFKRCETEFVLKNYEFLFFKKSYTNSSLINFCGRSGIRVDRVIQAEVLQAPDIINKCLSVSYAYRF